MMNLTATEWIVARVLYSLLATISIVGACSNLSLFFVTLRSKSLRSTCHLLIGLCALLDGLHQIGQLYQFPVLFSDGFIDSFVCSAIQARLLNLFEHPFRVLPEFGAMGGCACLLSIGIERLTAVVFITQYRKLSRRLLALHLSLVAFFGFYAIYLMVAYYQPTLLICAIPAPFHGRAAVLWGKTLGTLILFTIVVYCTVAVVISKRAEVSHATRKSFRSIFFVMTSDVSGWAIAISLLNISAAIDVTDETRFVMRYGCGLFVNMGIAAKAEIYYSTSTEYRQAFRTTFKRKPSSNLPARASTFASATIEITII